MRKRHGMAGLCAVLTVLLTVGEAVSPGIVLAESMAEFSAELQADESSFGEVFSDLTGEFLEEENEAEEERENRITSIGEGEETDGNDSFPEEAGSENREGNSSEEERIEGTDGASETETVFEKETVSETGGMPEAENPAGEEESLLPVDRVTAEDLQGILGEGVHEDVEAGIDAVEEILKLYPRDDGLLQLAAEVSGKTDETAADAAEAVWNGEQISETTEAALEHAGITAETESTAEPALCLARRAADLFIREVHAAEDRQGGKSIAFVPAADPNEGMVRLSSFALIRVKDGAGDWDPVSAYQQEGSGFDWKGNDSANDNGVVRTNDDVTYVFAYSTALTERYIYNTISGTRLYVAYRLPVSREEAEFHTEAMPWLKGEGEDGKPVILTEEDGSQLLIGYRELPDKLEGEERYDVPGAGTLNCVVSVKYMKCREKLKPSFYAWIEETGDHTVLSQHAVSCDTGKLSPEVQITCGAYVGISFEKSLHPTFTGYEDGGRIKIVDYRLTAGKPNGSVKGADRIDNSVPLKAGIKVSAEADTGYETGVEILDYATCAMKKYPQNKENHELACFFSGDSYMQANGSAVKNAASEEVLASCGVISEAGTEEGSAYFCVSGFTNTLPGSVLSEGSIVVRQKELQYGPSIVHYRMTVTGECVRAAGASGEEEFSQAFQDQEGKICYPKLTVENTIDPPGNWDAHLMLTPGKTWSRTAALITDGEFSTSGVTGYGTEFGIFINQHYTPRTEKSPAEVSKEWFVLWDNNKIELAVDEENLRKSATNDSPAGLGGDRPIYNNTGGSAVNHSGGILTSRLLYITKADGSTWGSDGEMLGADLRSFDTLRFWPDYAEAVSGGKKICGVLCEEWDIVQDEGMAAYDALALHMKTVDREENIGTSAMICYAMTTYSSNIKKTSTYGAAGSGTGEITPEKEYRDHTVKKWNMQTPRTYKKTERTSTGDVAAESLTAHNTVHEGNTLYIAGYQLMIRDTVGEDLEAVTYDLSEITDLTFRLSAGFQAGSLAEGVSAVIYSPDPAAEDGSGPAEWKEIRAVRPDGTEVVLQEETEYGLSDFIPGAPGSFVIRRGELSAVYSGKNISGDYLNGKIFRIMSADGSGSVLAKADGTDSGKDAAVCGTSDDKTLWRFKKMQGNVYRILNAKTGEALCVSGAEPKEYDKVEVKKISEENRSSYWLAAEQEDGRYEIRPVLSEQLKLTVSASGSGLVLLGTEGADWIPESSGEDAKGTEIRFSGLSSSYEFPVFLKKYSLDKSAVTEDITLTDTAVISGDGMTVAQSASNLHLASASAGFVETNSNVIRMEVDRAEIEDGSRLTYTIHYTNQYDHDHKLALSDILPSADEYEENDTGVIVRETDLAAHFEENRDRYESEEAYEKAKKEWAEKLLTVLRPGAEIRYVEDSLQVQTSMDSETEAFLSGDALHVSGILKSGETVTVSYRVDVQGADSGNVIRNSCVQKDEFGDVYSNRVETVVTGITAERGPVVSLTAGGSGNGKLYRGAAAVLLSVLLAGLADACRKRRQNG
ncbi:MAG: RICIN domain-containing protein [Lachnospiraceae bacterium]|nr:RICIN domain-containing protein [Lachnospiraceae bacterium]